MSLGSSASPETWHAGIHEKVAIVTDSIAQIPAALVKKYGIHVIPYRVTVAEKTYTDGVDLSVDELYKRMRVEKDVRLMTTAPSVGLFCKTFGDCREEGARRILYIGVSGNLSGAVNSATAASRMIYTDFGAVQITIFDSHMATIAQGFLALDAARMADEGAGVEEIVQHISEERKNVGFIAGFETLEYLARGGRIGKAAYLLSDAIKVVPLVTLNDDGEVIPVAKVFGHAKMMTEMIRYVKEHAGTSSILSVAIMHADTPEWAEQLRQMAVDELHPDEVFITDFTPVMVAHTGPGIIGIAYHCRPQAAP